MIGQIWNLICKEKNSKPIADSPPVKIVPQETGMKTLNESTKQNIMEQLKIDEGVKYEIYLDHLGLPTFGIGHLILASDPEYKKPVGTKISKERVDQAFTDDLRVAVDECCALYTRRQFFAWPATVQEILVNMMFNMGRTRLAGFVKFRAALEKGDWIGAAREGRDSLWYRQVTNRAERLMRRLERISG
jgi:lysozyme